MLLMTLQGCHSGEIGDYEVFYVTYIYPLETFPANSKMIIGLGRHSEMDSFSINIAGISGRIIYEAGLFLIWQPYRLLPEGEAIVFMTGQAADGRELELPSKITNQDDSFPIKIIPPDKDSPWLISTVPVENAEDVSSSLDENLLFVFSEAILWPAVEITIEPALEKIVVLQPLTPSNKFDTFYISNPRFKEDTAYTLTLSKIEDLAGNKGEDVQLHFKTIP